MKRIIYVFAVVMASVLPRTAFSQSDELQQLILNYEKLAQLKGILANMKKGYDILDKGYSSVKDLSNGTFRLHDAFLNGLLQVSPAVRNYKKAAEVIQYQAALLREYKAAYNGFRKEKHFRPDELGYLQTVYTRLFNESLEHLDELAMILAAGKLRMTDAERLEAIDRIHRDMEQKLLFLRGFNSKAGQVARYRAHLESANKQSRKAYGLTE